jgi:hypothetical protein
MKPSNDQIRLPELQLAEIDYTRIAQWSIFKENYHKLKLQLDKFPDKKLSLKDLNITITSPENAKILEIACVDEAVQDGEYSDEQYLDGELVINEHKIDGTSESKYILNIPGSGALKYLCNKCRKPGLTLQELGAIELGRLEDLAMRITNWCMAKKINKTVITYHEECGAVSLRRNSMQDFSDFTNTAAIIMAKDCAVRLARQIKSKSVLIGYRLRVTTAYIGKSSITKNRPPFMHNGLGALGCLDTNILCKEVDKATGLYFYDSLVPVEFTEGVKNSEYSIDLINSGISDLTLIVKIAFGQHGWGKDFFSKERPFFIMLFCNSQEQEDHAKDLYKKIIEKFEEISTEKLAFYFIRTD